MEPYTFIMLYGSLLKILSLVLDFGAVCYELAMNSSIWDRDVFVNLTMHQPSSLADSVVNHNMGGPCSVSTSEQRKKIIKHPS